MLHFVAALLSITLGTYLWLPVWRTCGCSSTRACPSALLPPSLPPFSFFPIASCLCFVPFFLSFFLSFSLMSAPSYSCDLSIHLPVFVCFYRSCRGSKCTLLPLYVMRTVDRECECAWIHRGNIAITGRAARAGAKWQVNVGGKEGWR
ncbi:uncharacterized protein BJ171DRAFT_169388 [Polychytrium aggregatum]|uniref:uncharacterized protein n=1 Tax=Polychytrium aggregatum TaxID=110093 RepID=UPI0022FECC10|nr:uncharacterized protein BJ171DRAFT_169388 [Polychytrium aggregatum]KAI9208846.1 hypothetical protein BJ171DRAFT_169388 [Polychytrium aggregatum]